MSEYDKLDQNELEEEVVEAPAAPEKAEKKSKDTDKKAKPGFFARVGKWFKEMKSELKKVQWPTKKTVIKNTGVVIACVIVVGVFIWVFDLLANSVVGALLRLFG